MQRKSATSAKQRVLISGQLEVFTHALVCCFVCSSAFVFAIPEQGVIWCAGWAGTTSSITGKVMTASQVLAYQLAMPVITS